MSELAGLKLFYGVAIERRIRARVARVQDELRQASLASGGARLVWVPEDAFHVTLRYLGRYIGRTDSERLEEMSAAAERIVGIEQAFELRITGLGAFPRMDRASVLWMGVRDPSGTLGRIAGELELAARAQGFAPEVRPFSPHLTLARVKGGVLRPGWEASVRKAIDEDLGEFVVREILLYESRAQAPRYVPVRRYQLTS